MQDADDVVDRPVERGKTGMTGLEEQPTRVANAGLDVQRDDLGAWRHQFANNRFVEIDDPADHATFGGLE